MTKYRSQLLAASRAVSRRREAGNSGDMKATVSRHFDRDVRINRCWRQSWRRRYRRTSADAWQPRGMTRRGHAWHLAAGAVRIKR